MEESRGVETVGWLAGRLAGWLHGGLADWLACWRQWLTRPGWPACPGWPTGRLLPALPKPKNPKKQKKQKKTKKTKFQILGGRGCLPPPPEI